MEKKTSIRLNEDLFWAFQAAQGIRRVSNEEAVEQAIADWIENDVSKSGVALANFKEAMRPLTPKEEKLLLLFRRMSDGGRSDLLEEAEKLAGVPISAMDIESAQKKGNYIHEYS